MKVEWIKGMPAAEGSYWIADNYGWVGLVEVEFLMDGAAIIRDSEVSVIEKSEFCEHWHFPADIPEPPA
jgi:hypothetical protein